MRRTHRASVGTLLVITALAVAARAGDPITKLVAADGVPSDNLGAAVAISGTTAIVAAPRDDVNGTQSGSAYLFDVTTGALLHKLTPNDGFAFDSFGFAVSISGDRSVGGSYKDDDNGSGSGSAYLFDVATGAQTHKLLPGDGALGDSFGFSVAIAGDVVVVGAPSDDDLGDGAGSAYVFDAATGDELFKLTASDGAAGDVFGNSVATDGTTIVVGAPGDDSSQGAAYLFDAKTGGQLDKLEASSGQFSAFFGRAVGVSGGRVLVGAPFASFGGASTGLAYLFDTNSGNQVATLIPSDGEAGDRFGNAVAISGDRGLVSAWEDDDFGPLSGAVYVIDVPTGSEVDKLTAHDASSFDRFGEAVGLSGDRAVVGAISAPGVTVNTGAAYGVSLADAPWDNLAAGKQGSVGVPSLSGDGDLSAGSTLCVALGETAPSSPVFLVIGVAPLFAPLKGGTLVPTPDVLLGGLVTDADGQLVLQGPVPQGTPAGIPLHLQAWIVDSPGFSASNGLVRVTP